MLLTHEENQTTAITIALRGAGGFGKTTLALALCHDPEVQAAFPDGILWVELGEHPPRPLAVLSELLHVLEPAEREALILEEARERWHQTLHEHTLLLVIDDVWQTETMEELLQGGPRCGRLVTTRNDQLLPETAKRVWVDAMEPAEAMALLCEGVIDGWRHTLDQSVLEQVVVQQLGCWPLLVSLARGMLTTQVRRLGKTPQQALALVEKAYEDRGMAAFHLGDRIERQRTADTCVEVNLRQLEEWVPVHYHARQRYQELAVFPEDTAIPLTMLQTYWQETGGLHAWEVEDLCLCLSDLSLLLPWDGEPKTARMHDVMWSYLIQRAGEHLPMLHSCLLDASWQKYGLIRWADLPPSEEYLWQHLILHLYQADRLDALKDTFSDLEYLTRKALYVGVSALETDLELACTWHSVQAVFPLMTELSRTIVDISHLLRQAHTIGEMGGTLLSYLPEKLATVDQHRALERRLPRPFLVPWHSLPNRASSALRRTLSGHKSNVSGCAVSPDGRFIVSASFKTLKVWEAATGAERLTLSGHTDRVNGCAFSPDGRSIVSASSDGTLKVWEAATGAELRTLSGHTFFVNAAVNAAAFSPDGKWIVSASYDRTLKVWEAATGAELRTLSGHTDQVNGCAFSPDGKWIVSASSDHTLKVWDVATGARRLTLSGHTDQVNGCAFSPDGKWIVSASYDRTLRVWDAATGARRLTLKGHTGVVWGCAVSPDNRWIVSASLDHTLKVWEAASGAEQLTLTGHTDQVNGCAVSPDGRFIVSASLDQTLKVWNVATRAERLTHSGHRVTINDCAVSPDGQWIVSASDDHTLKVWEAATGGERLTLSGHTNEVNGCAFSPDGRSIVSASSDGTLKVWEAATGAERLTLSGHTGYVRDCAVSPDGQWIVSAGDRTLKVWEAATGAEHLTLKGHTMWVFACAFSPDSRWIVSASWDGTLKVWEAATGAERLTLSGAGVVMGCAVSPDGRFIVSASLGGTLKVWEAATGAERLTLSGHTKPVYNCVVSPDGRSIVSASSDHTLKVWDVATGTCSLTFPVEGDLHGCAFHPDGKHLVACGDLGMFFLQLVIE